VRDAQVSEIRGESQRQRHRGGDFGVCNARSGQFFVPSLAASIGHFDDMVCAFKMAPSPSRHAMTGFFR
jgi:hypothetical protein